MSYSDNHLIFNKCEWNNCFVKNTHKISRILPGFICKNNNPIFSLFLILSRRVQYHIWRAWCNGSYTMMAKPIRALELHYPMIQFLIIHGINLNYKHWQNTKLLNTELTCILF